MSLFWVSRGNKSKHLLFMRNEFSFCYSLRAPLMGAVSYESEWAEASSGGVL